MIQQDWPRFVMAMTRLGVALDQPQTDERKNIYWDSLRTTRIEAIEFAALEAERTMVWFPKPVELSRLAALAPPLPALPTKREDVELLPADIDPPEVQLEKVRELAAMLNGNFGTSFGVGSELGRPVLVGGGLGKKNPQLPD